MIDSTNLDQKKSQLKTAISLLAMELELKEGRRFHITRGVEEVVKVLKFSLESHEPSVLDHLRKVVNLLSEKQLALFYAKGLDLSMDDLAQRLAEENHQVKQDRLYRGNSVAKDEPVDENKGKKKIVYRGQVKWV